MKLKNLIPGKCYKATCKYDTRNGWWVHEFGNKSDKFQAKYFYGTPFIFLQFQNYYQIKIFYCGKIFLCEFDAAIFEFEEL